MATAVRPEQQDGRRRRSPARPERVRLDLDGMTCASCAARIERKLNKLDGVEATVNFATERGDGRLRPAQRLASTT